MHMCMYLHVCRHVCVRHTCTYALDTAPMSQDTCRYSQIHTDTGMCISNVQCAYQICIELYPVHMSVHMCAVCDSHTCTYINPYVCYMCFTYMHICTGRITDVGHPWGLISNNIIATWFDPPSNPHSPFSPQGLVWGGEKIVRWGGR